MNEALNSPDYDFYFLHTHFVENRPKFQYIQSKREMSCFVVRNCDAGYVDGQNFSRLEDTPFVCVSHESAPMLYDVFMRICDLLSIRPKIVGFYNRAINAISAVSSGIGNTIVPQSLAEKFKDENVHLFPIVHEDALVESCLAWRDQELTSEAQLFLKVVSIPYKLRIQ